MVNASSRKGCSALGGLVSGVLISLLLLIALSFVAALVSYATENSTAGVGTFSLAALLISALISGFISAKRSGGFGSAVLTVTASMLLIAVVGLIVGCGKISLSGVMNCICYLGVGTAGAFIARRRVGKTKRRKRKH